MVCKEFIKVVCLLNDDTITRNIAIVIIILCTLIAIFLSSLAAFIIFLNYILGFAVCWCLIKYQKNASICLHRLVSFYRVRLSSNKHITSSCGVCNESLCDRHKLTKNTLPWKKIHLFRRLNTAIEHFYNRLIETFVTSWYSSFTTDITFLNELRFSLQYSTATATNKFLELDIGSLVANKMVPCAIKHIDDYLCMQQIAKLKNLNINKIAVDYLGRRLHVAVTNREYELNYLRQLTSCLMPKLLPEEYLNCSNYTTLLREIFAGWVLLPVMDVLADPNIINLFVVLSTNKQRAHAPVIMSHEKVEMFSSFIQKKVEFSALASDLKTVLRSQNLLYHFMQFLKREGSVHILQFCLDVEQFNVKLILPDLSKRQLENLHTEALNLYKIYISPKSPDFIGCSNDIVTELNRLLEEGVYNVAKLRTSEPLYKAYDHAFGLLENDYLPEFYHSNEFYSYLCGIKVTAAYKKSATNKQNPQSHGSPSKMRSRRYEQGSQGTVAKISSGLGKIKGALQTKQPIEGFYTPESQIYENDATHYSNDVVTPIIGFRDLTTWRISIRNFDTICNANHKVYNYCINIARIDTLPENELRRWTIHRKDNDFYILKAKLIEFHGENQISDLPPKRVLWAADPEARKLKYEEFLKQLLRSPLLRSSDLLYKFLTVEDFSRTMHAPAMGVDLENIYQSVAYKLRKEKGQHLDSFMNTFLASTDKIKQSRVEWAEIGDELDTLLNLSGSQIGTPKTFHSKIFGNNFDISQRKTENPSSSTFNPCGIAESLFYLLKHTFKVPFHILKLYTAICNVAQYAFESLCKMFIEKKIKSALSQNNLALLIELLEDIVFEKHSQPTPQMLEARKTNAFNELQNAIPQWLTLLMGEDFKLGAKNLLEILQNPLYNKQLAYNLLDIIIAELYPDLNMC